MSVIDHYHHAPTSVMTDTSEVIEIIMMMIDVHEMKEENVMIAYVMVELKNYGHGVFQIENNFVHLEHTIVQLVTKICAVK